jgi:hypothetical protein
MNRVGTLFLLYALLAAESGPTGQVAFTGEFDGKIYVLDVASKQINELPVGNLDVKDLAYSNKARRFAFGALDGHTERLSLYILSLKDGGKRRIYQATSGIPQLYRPMFDPTGENLYAVNFAAGVFRYSFARQTWDKVAITGAEHINPQGLSFSDSGQEVAILPGNFKGLLIARVLNGRFVIDKHVVPEFSAISPAWIGDEAIVFAGRRQEGLQFIWRLDVPSGKLTQLTSPPLGARDYLSLSADEKTIVFTGTDRAQADWKLWQVSVNGTQAHQLSPSSSMSDCLHPVWIAR